MAEPDIAKLIGDLTSPGWKFWVSRVGAVEALGALGTRAGQAVPTLVAAASKPDCDPSLLAAAVTTFGQIGPAARPAVPLLVRVIQDCGKMIEKPLDMSGPDSAVLASITGPKFLRWAATQAVGKILGKPWGEDDNSTKQLLLWWESGGSKEAW